MSSKTKKNSITLPDWDRGRTKCKWCSEDLIYYIYKVGNKGEKRKVPDTHNGNCSVLYTNKSTILRPPKTVNRTVKKKTTKRLVKKLTKRNAKRSLL